MRDSSRVVVLRLVVANYVGCAAGDTLRSHAHQQRFQRAPIAQIAQALQVGSGVLLMLVKHKKCSGLNTSEKIYC